MPEWIGEFKILDEIGRGGMGVVYLARQPSLGRLVAVKMMSVDVPELAARLKNEARILGELQHPHIVSVLDVGDDEGAPYYAMAYCAGGSLAQVLARDGTLSAGQTAHVLAVVAEALAAMHGHGLVHRDVKPSNVLLSDDGEPYLSDFGLALGAGSRRVTSSGAVLGTIGYAAPELLGGEQVTPAADVFSLGVMGYQLLTGEIPFKGAHIFGVIEAVRTGRFAPLEEAAPDTGGELVQLITSCLCADPAARPSDLRALASSLRSSATSERLTPTQHLKDSDRTLIVGRRHGDAASLKSAPGPTTRRWRRPGVLLPMMGIVLLLALLGGLLLATNRKAGISGARTSSAAQGAGAAVKVSSGPEAGVAGLTATRTWTAEGLSFVSTIEVSNGSSQPVTSYHAEVIPKGVATSTTSVTFEPTLPRVLKEDPIVAWDLTLAPGEKRTLGYRAILAKALTAADLTSFEAERAAGYRALLEFIGAQGGSGQTAPPDLAAFTPAAPAASTPPAGPATQAPTGGAPAPVTSAPPNRTVPVTPAPTQVARPTDPPAPISSPGAVGDVLVQNPTGDNKAITVTLTWSRPATTGGQIVGYRIRRTTFAGPIENCEAPSVVRAGPVTADTAADTHVTVSASGATDFCLSWVRWEIAAFNSVGVGPFVPAAGVLPDVRGLQNSYHLIRAVGGRAGGGNNQFCGVPPDAACGTSGPPGTRIANGSDVTIFLQQ